MDKKVFIFVIMTLAFFQMFGQNSPIELYKKAQNNLSTGQFSNAIELAGQIKTQLGQTNPKLETLLVQAYFYSNDIVNAQVSFEKLLKITPFSVQQSEAFKPYLDLGNQIKTALEREEKKFKEDIKKEKQNRIRRAQQKEKDNNNRNIQKLNRKRRTAKNADYFYKKAVKIGTKKAYDDYVTLFKNDKTIKIKTRLEFNNRLLRNRFGRDLYTFTIQGKQGLHYYDRSDNSKVKYYIRNQQYIKIVERDYRTSNPVSLYNPDHFYQRKVRKEMGVDFGQPKYDFLKRINLWNGTGSSKYFERYRYSSYARGVTGVVLSDNYMLIKSYNKVISMKYAKNNVYRYLIRPDRNFIGMMKNYVLEYGYVSVSSGQVNFKPYRTVRVLPSIDLSAKLKKQRKVAGNQYERTLEKVSENRAYYLESIPTPKTKNYYYRDSYSISFDVIMNHTKTVTDHRAFTVIDGKNNAVNFNPGGSINEFYRFYNALKFGELGHLPLDFAF